MAVTSFKTVTICTGDATQLSASGGTLYSWTPAAGLSATLVSNPIASPATTTQYVVTVSNQFACADTAAVLVNVNENVVNQNYNS